MTEEERMKVQFNDLTDIKRSGQLFKIDPPTDLGPQRKARFRKELIDLINKHSLENESDTPDFVLANYMMRCLTVFEEAIAERAEWYERS